jgi:hypothetical protein
VAGEAQLVLKGEAMVVVTCKLNGYVIVVGVFSTFDLAVVSAEVFGKEFGADWSPRRVTDMQFHVGVEQDVCGWQDAPVVDRADRGLFTPDRKERN